MRRRLWLAVAVLSMPVCAAEGQCTARDTPRECVQRLRAQRDAAVTAAVAAANTGAAVRDFASVAAVYLDAALGEDRREEIAVSWNLLQQVQLETMAGNAQSRAMLSLNAATRHLGRSIAPHRDTLDALLLQTLAPAAGEELGGVAWTSFDVPFETIVSDPALRTQAMDMFALAVRSAPAAERVAEQFAALLANQPQLYVSAAHERTDGGPRVSKAGLTYEISTWNLNGFRRQAGAFDEYVRQRARRDAGRLALSLAYDRVETAHGPSYALAYALPPLWTAGRVDLTAAYNTVHANRERATAAVTYTHQLSRRVLVPVGMSWTERSETVPGACTVTRVSPPIEVCAPPVTSFHQGVTFHTGIVFKFTPRKPEPATRQPCDCPPQGAT